MQAFAGCGGYILQDGNNVAPGTPLHHLKAVVEAAEETGSNLSPSLQ
jgi:uroporphyrinogen-III decarboxylase